MYPIISEILIYFCNLLKLFRSYLMGVMLFDLVGEIVHVWLIFDDCSKDKLYNTNQFRFVSRKIAVSILRIFICYFVYFTRIVYNSLIRKIRMKQPVSYFFGTKILKWIFSMFQLINKNNIKKIQNE